jgi:hypothetical protein
MNFWPLFSTKWLWISLKKVSQKIINIDFNVISLTLKNCYKTVEKGSSHCCTIYHVFEISWSIISWFRSARNFGGVLIFKCHPLLLQGVWIMGLTAPLARQNCHFTQSFSHLQVNFSMSTFCATGKPFLSLVALLWFWSLDHFRILCQTK